jgi:hypothetical protein
MALLTSCSSKSAGTVDVLFDEVLSVPLSAFSKTHVFGWLMDAAVAKATRAKTA